MPKIVVDATRLYPYLVFLKLPEEVRDALEDNEKDSTALFSHCQQLVLELNGSRGAPELWGPTTYRS